MRSAARVITVGFDCFGIVDAGVMGDSTTICFCPTGTVGRDWIVFLGSNDLNKVSCCSSAMSDVSDAVIDSLGGVKTWVSSKSMSPGESNLSGSSTGSGR